MLNPSFLEAIKIISSIMDKEKIKWAIIGSTNMALHGMNITPQDLDIIINIKDMKKTESIFKNYLTSKITDISSKVKRPAWEILLNIDGIEAQILGENEEGEYAPELKAQNIDKIQLDNLKIPCLTLEAEAEVYSKTNRQQKADLINSFLKNTSN